MGSPAWSPAALTALRKLHGVQYIVYVEGKTDIPFWRAVFGKVGVESFFIKPAGDCHQLAYVARAVAEDGAEVIVAGDRDYRPWVGDHVDHHRVIYSYGYSVENSLYCPKFVSELIQDCAAVQGDQSPAVEEAIEKLAYAVIELVVLDVADQLADCGVGPLGVNSARFLSNKVEPKVDQIEMVRKAAEETIDAAAVEKARELLDTDPRPLCLVVRGHFLTHLVMRIVEHVVKSETGDKFRIPLELLRAGLVGKLAGEWPLREDFIDLRDRVEAAFAA